LPERVEPPGQCPGVPGIERRRRPQCQGGDDADAELRPQGRQPACEHQPARRHQRPADIGRRRPVDLGPGSQRQGGRREQERHRLLGHQPNAPIVAPEAGIAQRQPDRHQENRADHRELRGDEGDQLAGMEIPLPLANVADHLSRIIHQGA